MVITAHGEGVFRVQIGETVIAVDPMDSRIKADILLKTRLETAKFPFPTQMPEISGAGEYEVKGIEISGYLAKTSKSAIYNIYVVMADELRLAFFGNLDSAPDESALKNLSQIDIAFMPPALAKLAKTLQPNIVVPAYYKQTKAAAEVFGGKSETADKLVIKKKDLPQGMKVIILKY